MATRWLFDRLFPNEPRQRIAFHQEIQARLPGAGRVLDLGCGRNVELESYRTEQLEVWGVDLRQHPDMRHEDWFRPLGASGAIPFPDQHFDLVAACWVLEHVADPQLFMAEVDRVLRPGGALIALTISGSHYVTWITRGIGRLPDVVSRDLVKRLYDREPHDHFPTYHRMNTARRLAAASTLTSLHVVRIKRFADQGYFRFSKLIRSIATVADWCLEQLVPGCGRIYLTVVCEKKSSAVSSTAEKASGFSSPRP
jgi:2-polyprenyl-3-methyl-5-hydroxy-6-metoxy-1,4-benzoquinol methylase